MKSYEKCKQLTKQNAKGRSRSMPQSTTQSANFRGTYDPTKAQTAGPYVWSYRPTATSKGIFHGMTIIAYTVALCTIRGNSEDRFPLRKISIGSDPFPSCIIYTAEPKKVEITSTLYHPGCGSQVQTRTEN